MATRATKKARTSTKTKEKFATPRVCPARQNVLADQRLLLRILTFLPVDSDFLGIPRTCTALRAAMKQGEAYSHLNFTRDFHAILHKPSTEAFVFRLIAKAGASIKSINIEPRWLNNFNDSLGRYHGSMEDMMEPFRAVKRAATANIGFVTKVIKALQEQKANRIESLAIRLGFDHSWATIRDRTADFAPIEQWIQTAKPRQVVLGPELYSLPKQLLQSMPALEYDGFTSAPCSCAERKQALNPKANEQKDSKESKVNKPSPVSLSTRCQVCSETTCTKCGEFDDCYREVWLCVGCNRSMDNCIIPHKCDRCDFHSKLCTDCKPFASPGDRMLANSLTLFGGAVRVALPTMDDEHYDNTEFLDPKKLKSKKSKAERSHFAMPVCPATNCSRRICGNQCLMHCSVCLEPRCPECIVRAKDDPENKPICNTCKKRKLY